MKNEGAKEGKDKDPKADDKDKEKEKWGLFIFVDRFLLYLIMDSREEDVSHKIWNFVIFSLTVLELLLIGKEVQ